MKKKSSFQHFSKDFNGEVRKDETVNPEEVVTPEKIHRLELDLGVRKKGKFLKKKPE